MNLPSFGPVQVSALSVQAVFQQILASPGATRAEIELAQSALENAFLQMKSDYELLMEELYQASQGVS